MKNKPGIATGRGILMKAAVYTKYGPPDVLQLKEVEIPTPKDDEVLIKIHATSVNASDWECLRGKPLYARYKGLFKPGIPILGSDIAGTVEAVGKNVTKFQPDDAVFGDILDRMGGFAEYVCCPEGPLMLKPAEITFEEAAAIPQSSEIAIQGIRVAGAVRAGQKVLINGAGGGATFAVQLAKLFGAEVTAVDNASKLAMLRSIGADHVIDYRQEDFTKNGQTYDLILDLVSNRSVFAYLRSLAPNGKCFIVGGAMPALLQAFFLGPLVKKVTGKKVSILAVQLSDSKVLAEMITLIEKDRVKPIIDKHFPLADVPEALRYLGEGHAKGKIVVTMA